MKRKSQKQNSKFIRKARVRKKLIKNLDRPRLSVFRSHKHFYAQIIDDEHHQTLVSASTLSKELKGKVKKNVTLDVAKEVGHLIAKKAQEKKISKVCLDRGSYLYHGRIKAFAEAARESGLHF